MNDTPLLSDRAYNALKNVNSIILPGLGALYYGLAEIWNLSGGEKVVATVTVVVTFFGLLLKMAERSYDNSDLKYDGTMNVAVDPQTGMKTAELEFTHDPEENEALENKKEIRFKVDQKEF